MEHFGDFYTGSDRELTRSPHLVSTLRKAFKATWKGVLDADTFRDCALLLCELVKDPPKKVLLSPSFLL